MNKVKPIIGILLLLGIAFYGYRHRAGSGPVLIDTDAMDEYRRIIDAQRRF